MSDSKAASWLYSQNQFGDSTPPKSSARTIAITSGKGGVGKTSIAVKFSKILATMDKKVLLIDCDYNLSNTAIKLGLPITDSFASLINSDNEMDFDDCIHIDGNLHVLSACNGNLDILENKSDISAKVISYIMSKEKDYDYILLDCPAGIDRGAMSLNSYCDHRFVVVTPDKSSITDSYSLIKVLSKKYGVKENHLFVNKVRGTKDYRRVVKVISETVDDFLGVRVQVLGGLPLENISSSDFDKLVVGEENSSFHKSFYKLVGRFTEMQKVTALSSTTQINEELLFERKRQDVRSTIC